MLNTTSIEGSTIKTGGTFMAIYPVQLKPLPYGYTELEPCISKATMELHHDKHLKAYVDNLNNAIAKHAELQDKPVDTLLAELSKIESSDHALIRNNGGGVFNHFFYFDALTAPNTSKPSEAMLKGLTEAFGGEDAFYEQFKAAGLTQFGSGWAWLVMDQNKKLSIIKTANQDTPLELNLIPLFNMDVWEHAYYLDYQNRRADHIDAYFTIMNWSVVEDRWNKAK